eukprot:Gb_30052 [translate_table: standard]
MASLHLQTTFFSSPVTAPPNSSFNLAYFHVYTPSASSHRKKVAVSATSAEPGKPDSPQPEKTVSRPAPKKKPVYSLKKKQIVRVDKEKYLNSINVVLELLQCIRANYKLHEDSWNYLSVGHPKYYKGLDYIYEDRGEVLDVRFFETGEYALIAWVGVPTAPAWLPTDMLIKSDKLNYERM